MPESIEITVSSVFVGMKILKYFEMFSKFFKIFMSAWLGLSLNKKIQFVRQAKDEAKRQAALSNTMKPFKMAGYTHSG